MIFFSVFYGTETDPVLGRIPRRKFYISTSHYNIDVSQKHREREKMKKPELMQVKILDNLVSALDSLHLCMLETIPDEIEEEEEELCNAIGELIGICNRLKEES